VRFPIYNSATPPQAACWKNIYATQSSCNCSRRGTSRLWNVICHSTEHEPIGEAGTNAVDRFKPPRTHETLSSAAKTIEPVVVPATNAVQRNTQPTDSSEDAHKTYVEQRSSQLMEMAMNDDRGSLDTILSELGNRDPEIRKAALEATIQFGSRDAIPKLADAVSQTDDPSEKAALTDAIEFLKLPSLTEIRQQSGKSVAHAAAPGSKSGRKGGFGKRDLPAPAPQANQ